MAGCEQGVVLQLPMEVELEAPTLHPGKYLLPPGSVLVPLLLIIGHS